MSLGGQLQSKSKMSAGAEFKFSTHEHTAQNERVKSGRPHSPAPSSMSLRSERSMDPLTNFRGAKESSLDSREKLERAASPISSYMSLRTDWSMDPPSNLKDFLLDARGRPERAPSPTPSHLSQISSDWSAEPSIKRKAEDNFLFNPRMLTDNHLKCPLCKSMLKDPVSITCGHSFCRDCINAFWDNCAGDFACPHCGQASETRPVLNTNVALAEVVKDLQQTFSPALPPQSYAGPEDVACDFCTEDQLKAVKSCSTCGVFLCETHIRKHYTIPALQKHTLRDVTGEDQMTMKTDDITSGQQNQTDEAQDRKKDEIERILESMLNNSESTCADVSRPETEMNKEDLDVGNLASNFSNLASSAVKQNFLDVDNYEEDWEIGDHDGEGYSDEYDDEPFDYNIYYDDYGDDCDTDVGYDYIHDSNDWDDDYALL